MLLKSKKILLASSAVLLFSLGAGVASAADTPIQAAVKANASTDLLTYQVTLKVGETYQLPYGRNYKYSKYQYASDGPYFSVSSSGLVTALKNPYFPSGEAIGSVGILQEGVRDIALVYIEITN
ncbi:hypothetical protein [Paenibacillus polymyxa]|uniref:hypothetical protein n=1 Tax=Paenibacillus polymyxa TaxID=1406 RepID=UPI0003D351E9|nr:hypothetical protein [Paenibacillus polymyxa]AHC22701.1 hypothetical protein X809_06415 [Paenibacillus polymyxa CR1]